MGLLDNNYISQLKNINAQLEDTNLKTEQIDALESQRSDAALNMGLTGLQGGLQLANQYVMNSMGADTSMYDAAIAGMSRNRGHNTFDNTQLLDYYNSNPTGFKANVKDLNKTGWESAASIGSSALTGGIAGVQIGGVPGLILGTGAGLLLGTVADANARKTNAHNARIANAAQNYEKGMNATALNSNADLAKQTMFGTQYGQRLASGGFIKACGSKSRYFQHSKCKGGTMVRVKIK